MKNFIKKLFIIILVVGMVAVLFLPALALL